jgi:hypothetical protein
VHNPPANTYIPSGLIDLAGRYVKLLSKYPNTNNWSVQNGTVQSVASETDMRLILTADQAKDLPPTALNILYAVKPSSEAVVYRDDEHTHDLSSNASSSYDRKSVGSEGSSSSFTDTSSSASSLAHRLHPQVMQHQTHRVYQDQLIQYNHMHYHHRHHICVRGQMQKLTGIDIQEQKFPILLMHSVVLVLN